MKMPSAPSIAAALTFTSFLSFMPLFVWHKQALLALAATLTFLTFLFVGTASLYGSNQTVVSIAWGGRKSPSDKSSVIQGRVLGGIMLAFTLFCMYSIFDGGLRSTYEHIGR